MSNQYCKITSWIEHHKDHGDAKYAEAISDLCLDSWLKPGKYNGLTFLYQTNKTVRKKFCDKVFTPESREACDEFKRYIIPDVFHSCEDFQQKDVGNVLGYKYEVKSCDKHKVVFENGMTIEPLLGHNSFESLSPNLKEVIKIFYVTKGEPPESGEPYRVTHRKREKKPRTVGGNAVDCERVLNDKVMPMFSDGSHLISLHNAFGAFSACIPELEKELSDSDSTYVNTIQDLLAMQHTFSSTKSGILDYICYILDSLWDEQDTNRSNQLSVICTKLLNIIHEELCKSSQAVDRSSWETVFHAACGHIFTPDKITAEVFAKMSKTMNAAIAEHEEDSSKKNILELYLSKSAANGILWGIKLFPVIDHKESLHKAALSRRLLTCETFNSSSGEYLMPSDEFIAKVKGIFYYYEQCLVGHPTWEHTNHLTPIMAANIGASIVPSPLENSSLLQRMPQKFEPSDFTNSPMKSSRANSSTSDIDSESLFT